MQDKSALAANLKKLIQETLPESVKVPQQPGQPIDLAKLKITKDNLSPELLEFIQSKQIVQIQIPGQISSKTDVPGADSIPQFFKVLDDMFLGNNVFLVGEAGTGKSHLAVEAAWAFSGLDRKDPNVKPPYVIISCNQWTSPTKLVGGQTIDGYKEGDLIRAWSEGLVVILDELPKLDPNTAGVLNDILAKSADEGDRSIIFNGNNPAQGFKKHPKFACIATGNTTGKGTSAKYGGNNKQDASLIDRFSGNYYQVGFNRELEKSVVFSKVFEICDAIRDQLLKYEGDEGDAEDIMTLRTMLSMNRVYLLEMLREAGIPDEKGNRITRNVRGKTLKDSIESYLSLFTPDKAKQVRESVVAKDGRWIGLNGFYNNYKDVTTFRAEWDTRKKQ